MALLVDPLAMAVFDRYEFVLEVLPVAHHAFAIRPFMASRTGTTTGPDIQEGRTIETNPTTLNGYGVELGYRFYTSDRGPIGGFIGPSFMVGKYTARYVNMGFEAPGVTAYGVALDFGVQFVVIEHLRDVHHRA